jgi:CMP-N-acetylneuraminic acid synthetase
MTKLSAAKAMKKTFKKDNEKKRARNNDEKEEQHTSLVELLKENGFFYLIDWKALQDPELKKQFGARVINALNIAAGIICKLIFILVAILTFTVYF